MHESLWQNMPLELLVVDVCNAHSSLGSHVFCCSPDIGPPWNLHELCFAHQLFLTYLSPPHAASYLPRTLCDTLMPLLAGHFARSFRQDLGKCSSPDESPQKALHHCVLTAKTL